MFRWNDVFATSTWNHDLPTVLSGQSEKPRVSWSSVRSFQHQLPGYFRHMPWTLGDGLQLVYLGTDLNQRLYQHGSPPNIADFYLVGDASTATFDGLLAPVLRGIDAYFQQQEAEKAALAAGQTTGRRGKRTAAALAEPVAPKPSLQYQAHLRALRSADRVDILFRDGYTKLEIRLHLTCYASLEDALRRQPTAFALYDGADLWFSAESKFCYENKCVVMRLADDDPTYAAALLHHADTFALDIILPGWDPPIPTTVELTARYAHMQVHLKRVIRNKIEGRVTLAGACRPCNPCCPDSHKAAGVGSGDGSGSGSGDGSEDDGSEDDGSDDDGSDDDGSNVVAKCNGNGVATPSCPSRPDVGSTNEAAVEQYNVECFFANRLDQLCLFVSGEAVMQLTAASQPVLTPRTLSLWYYRIRVKIPLSCTFGNMITVLETNHANLFGLNTKPVYDRAVARYVANFKESFYADLSALFDRVEEVALTKYRTIAADVRFPVIRWSTPAPTLMSFADIYKGAHNADAASIESFLATLCPTNA